MANQYKNKIIYGNQTLMDITDTTATENDVLEGEVFYSASGARSTGTLGDATTTTHGLMSATDKTKLDTLSNLDVQINGTSIVSNDIAQIPIASDYNYGAVKTNSSYGITVTGSGELRTALASDYGIQTGASSYLMVPLSKQHQSVFYGLAKAAGDSTQSASANTVGTYTDSAKTAIQNMLGIPTKVSDLTNDAGYLTVHQDVSGKIDKSAFNSAGISSYTYVELCDGEFSVTTTQVEDETFGYARASVTGRFDKQYIYRVTIGETQYIVPCQLWFEDNKVYEYLGNLEYYGESKTYIPGGFDDTRPFLIISDLNNSESIDVWTDEPGTYTIKIEQMQPVQAPIPKSLIYGNAYEPILTKINGGTYEGTSMGVNKLSSSRGTFAFGYGNKINANFDFAIGLHNDIQAANSISISAAGNTIKGTYSIGIGSANILNNGYTYVLGENNNITGTYNYIFGYDNITNSGGYNFIIGDSNITANETYCSILIGSQLVAASSYTIILGKYNNNTQVTKFPYWTANTSYEVGDTVDYGAGFICTTANSDSTFTSSKWSSIGYNSNTLLILGNGTSSSNKSNALKINTDGSAYFKGKVYVNCSADSSGGTELATTAIATTSAAGLMSATDKSNLDTLVAGGSGSGGGAVVDATVSLSGYAADAAATRTLIDSKAPSIKNVVSGTSVTFMNGANNMPLDSLKLKIDIVQSGTGDPSPTNIRSFTGYSSATITHGDGTNTPTTYTISFGDAGTVYCGSLNVTTGVLTVEYEMLSFVWGNVRGATASNTGFYGYSVSFTNTVEAATSGTSYGVVTYCNALSKIAWEGADYSQAHYYIGSNNKLNIFLPSDNDSDTIQVLGKLVTPLTYQLTPQQIRTFLGENQISTNLSSITECKYVIDTQEGFESLQAIVDENANTVTDLKKSVREGAYKTLVAKFNYNVTAATTSKQTYNVSGFSSDDDICYEVETTNLGDVKCYYIYYNNVSDYAGRNTNSEYIDTLTSDLSTVGIYAEPADINASTTMTLKIYKVEKRIKQELIVPYLLENAEIKSQVNSLSIGRWLNNHGNATIIEYRLLRNYPCAAGQVVTVMVQSISGTSVTYPAVITFRDSSKQDLQIKSCTAAELAAGVQSTAPTNTAYVQVALQPSSNGGYTDSYATYNNVVVYMSNSTDLKLNSIYTARCLPMVGATASVAGTSGAVPAPTTSDIDKFLAGDGTWKSGGKPMVILSYGTSTWNDFITAYQNNVIVYCRASSNSNPATGSQTRMAFMAYVSDATNPTNVEFQYYRSMSSHSATAMGDEVYVYKLTNANGGTWSVTTRKASIKEIDVASGSKLGVSWNSDKVTLSNTMTADDMPMSSSDATTTKAAIDTLSNNLTTQEGRFSDGVLKIANGGTGASTVIEAVANLSLGKLYLLQKASGEFSGLLTSNATMYVIFATRVSTNTGCCYLVHRYNNTLYSYKLYGDSNYTIETNSQGTVVVKYSGSSANLYATAIRIFQS